MVSRRARILLVVALVAVLAIVLGMVAFAGGDRASQGDDMAAPTSITSGVEVSEATEVENTAETLDPDRPLRSFTFAATGDFLLHAPVQRRAASNAGGVGYSFAPMLRETAPIISGVDLALCHMETPVSENNTNLSGYPLFNAPREILADAKGAGYDGCSTASNHSIDKGSTGVAGTLNVLDQAGLKHAGTRAPRSKR